MDLRSQIQQIALRWPAYGYRRVHAELRRHGWSVNHKRILRWLRADNLLCLRRRKFILTTDSQHGLPIYPNLVEGMAASRTDGACESIWSRYPRGAPSPASAALAGAGDSRRSQAGIVTKWKTWP
jgi:transposase InsO family protein